MAAAHPGALPLCVLLAGALAGCSAPAPVFYPVEGAGGSAGTGGTGGEQPACVEFGPAAPAGQLPDGPLDEVSGIAASRRNPGVLWLLEDSGNEPELHAIDRAGKRLFTLFLTGTDNVDFEDLALGPCDSGDCLFVGDIGDNGEQRTDLAILRLPEPLLPETGAGRTEDRSARPTRFPFRYPEGPQDAEALVVTPEGEVVVLTKRRDGTALVYGLGPLTAGTVATAKLLGDLDVRDGPTGLFASATGASLSPDGTLLLVRTYGAGFAFRLAAGGLTAPGAALREPLPVAAEPQGEAIAYDPLLRGFWQLGEGSKPPLYFGPCRR